MICDTRDTVAHRTWPGCTPVSAGQAPDRTDFSAWDRKTLEQFAREAADANEVLRQDLRLAMTAWREAVGAPRADREIGKDHFDKWGMKS